MDWHSFGENVAETPGRETVWGFRVIRRFGGNHKSYLVSFKCRQTWKNFTAQLYYPNNCCIKCLSGLSLLSDFCLLYPHSKASVNGKEYFHGSGEVSIFPIFFSFLTNCQIFPKLIFYPVCLSIEGIGHLFSDCLNIQSMKYCFFFMTQNSTLWMSHPVWF